MAPEPMPGGPVEPRNPLGRYNSAMPRDIRDLPRPAAVIFDLDGTLVDTVQTRIDAWLETFEEVGLPATKDQLGPLIGVDGKRLARRGGGPRRPAHR